MSELQNIFDTKKEFNKWLKELTESEVSLIIEMMNEASQLGYDSGMRDAHSSFQDEVSYRGWH